jgi:hypothetical protein
LLPDYDENKLACSPERPKRLRLGHEVIGVVGSLSKLIQEWQRLPHADRVDLSAIDELTHKLPGHKRMIPIPQRDWRSDTYLEQDGNRSLE